MSQLPKRILSIDVFRAVTMFLMIFVNEVAGVSHIPEWIKHTAADVDGMGFSDIIFPAFLFIVGLSLPFAIQARIKKGDSTFALFQYVGLRALALIVMGVFHVNFGGYNSELAVISYPIYKIIVTLGFFLVWIDYPETLAKKWRQLLTAIGVITLLAMAYLYVGGTAAAPKGLTPQWWGILGIIGWAYLFSAITYILSKGKLAFLAPAFVLFALINITTHSDLLHLNLFTIGDASSITLMLSGTLVSVTYSLLISKGKDRTLWTVLATAGTLAIVLGFILRPYAGGISKIYATPAWVFICMGISLLTFEFFIYLVDRLGKKDWFNFIKPAGTSALTCYLIPYLLYSVFTLIDFHYPPYFSEGIGGMLRSLFISIVVIRLVTYMEKVHLRLKV